MQNHSTGVPRRAAHDLGSVGQMALLPSRVELDEDAASRPLSGEFREEVVRWCTVEDWHSVQSIVGCSVGCKPLGLVLDVASGAKHIGRQVEELCTGTHRLRSHCDADVGIASPVDCAAVWRWRAWRSS